MIRALFPEELMKLFWFPAMLKEVQICLVVFYVILLTNKWTDAGEKIASLAEVTHSNIMVLVFISDVSCFIL